MTISNKIVTTRITKIGNSKGIIVPSIVVKSLALDEGDAVELEYIEDTQTLRCSFPHTKQLKLLGK
jgi:antitoxin component of MazEF toxin-antitoxin module